MNRKLIYFLPRIISILFVGFISIFALDVFGAYQGWELVVALFIHLLPSLGLLVVALIAWRYGLIGAAVFIGFSAFYTWQAREHLSWILIIAGPSLLIGFLYLWDWYLKNKK